MATRETSARGQGWSVHRAHGGTQGLRVVADVKPEVVVCDLHMPDVDGFAVIAEVNEKSPNVPVVVLSGDEDLTAVLGAVRGGAFDYVVKSGDDLGPLGEAVRRALEHHRLLLQNESLSADLDLARDRLAAQLNQLNRQHELLQEAQAKSERLLLNILPRSIARRLQDDERRQRVADEFTSVTVLFADIVGFTPLSAAMTPDELVGLLDEVFSRFDTIATELGVEKIKTIGDAYMAAAGLPERTDDHAEVAALMALRMVDAMEEINARRETALQLRIGLHSGTVVAGVIGKNKFTYDLWGDAVNTAARMESHSVAGAVQVSAATAGLLADRFDCEPRGEIEIKGKGRMKTFLLKGLR